MLVLLTSLHPRTLPRRSTKRSFRDPCHRTLFVKNIFICFEEIAKSSIGLCTLGNCSRNSVKIKNNEMRPFSIQQLDVLNIRILKHACVVWRLSRTCFESIRFYTDIIYKQQKIMYSQVYLFLKLRKDVVIDDFILIRQICIFCFKSYMSWYLT